MKKDEFLDIFPSKFHSLLGQAADAANTIREVRLRSNAPLIINNNGQEYYISNNGNFTNILKEAYYLTKNDIELFLSYVCQNSIYAFEEEIKKGFLTISGGHRIGIAGQVVLDTQGNIKTIKNISYLNIRIAHEIKGVSDEILPILYHNRRLLNTLIIAPPGCGKTTLLRDIVRQVSDGNLYGNPCQVSVVDERSEIAGCYRGIPQNHVGIRTDVLDACPKRIGMMMLLRTMSPQVMAIDELGGMEDVEALYHVVNAGCTILVTIHGEDIEEIRRKRYLSELLEEKVFKRYVILDKQNNKFIIKQKLKEDLQEC